MDGEREGEPPIIVKVRVTSAYKGLYRELRETEPKLRAQRLRILAEQSAHDQSAPVAEGPRKNARAAASEPGSAQQQESAAGADNYLDRIRL